MCYFAIGFMFQQYDVTKQAYNNLGYSFGVFIIVGAFALTKLNAMKKEKKIKSTDDVDTNNKKAN